MARALFLSALPVALAQPPPPGAVCGRKGQTARTVVKGADLTGQVHVLTGGDSGIGYEAAMALGTVHASLIIASYDADRKGAAACSNITAKTGAECRVVAVDLSSLASVRACAAAVLKLTSRIDVFVADAGIACAQTSGKYSGNGCVDLSAVTPDGFERVVETDYLGHFLMIELLLPTLRKSKARIINVASSSSNYACVWANHIGAKGACMDTDQLQDRVTLPPKGTNTFAIPASNYGVSKYLQIFHAAELARREKANGITAFSLHPGVVGTSMMAPVPKLTAKLWCEGQSPCPFTPAEGGATPAYIASAPAAHLQPGKYYVDCTATNGVIEARVSRTSKAQSDAYASDLYEKTLAWVNGAPAPAPPAPSPSAFAS